MLVVVKHGFFMLCNSSLKLCEWIRPVFHYQKLLMIKAETVGVGSACASYRGLDLNASSSLNPGSLLKLMPGATCGGSLALR